MQQTKNSQQESRYNSGLITTVSRVLQFERGVPINHKRPSGSRNQQLNVSRWRTNCWGTAERKKNVDQPPWRHSWVCGLLFGRNLDFSSGYFYMKNFKTLCVRSGVWKLKLIRLMLITETVLLSRLLEEYRPVWPLLRTTTILYNLDYVCIIITGCIHSDKISFYKTVFRLFYHLKTAADKILFIKVQNNNKNNLFIILWTIPSCLSQCGLCKLELQAYKGLADRQKAIMSSACWMISSQILHQLYILLD